jgi:hypothetical protein
VRALENLEVQTEGDTEMKRIPRRTLVILGAAVLLMAASASAQIYKYYSPGTIWTVTTIRIKSGMDPAYLGYLDSQFKKESDAQVNAGYMKSYKILRTLDDDSGWNLLILREYKNLASLEADAEKADALSQRVAGTDAVQMSGYEDRSKIREVLATKTARELILK